MCRARQHWRPGQLQYEWPHVSYVLPSTVNMDGDSPYVAPISIPLTPCSKHSLGIHLSGAYIQRPVVTEGVRTMLLTPQSRGPELFPGLAA